MKTNIRLLLLLTGLLLIILSTQALSKKDTPICFRHKETNNFMRPCQTFKSDNDAYTRIFCMDAENKTMQPFTPNMDHWEQLEGDICDPQKLGPDVPRGMESVKQEVIDLLHQKIEDSEKRKQMEAMINAMSEKELIEWLNEIDSEKNTPPERQHWNEINQQVVKAYQSGHYSKGIAFAEKAYQYALKNFGETDPDTLSSINNLAALYESQGRYGEAEPLYKRCLQLSEEVLGPKHPSTLRSINNLAALYESQGRYGVPYLAKHHWVESSPIADKVFLTAHSDYHLGFV